MRLTDKIDAHGRHEERSKELEACAEEFLRILDKEKDKKKALMYLGELKEKKPAARDYIVRNYPLIVREAQTQF